MGEIIRKIVDHPELVPQAAHWFQHTFGVPEEAYRESMEQCLKRAGPVPQWYVVMEGDAIIAGLGVIENDFHDRKDLAPNVCAVYVEEPRRGRGVARRMLNYVCQDMAERGVSTLYLVTGHTGFYERYGWEFFCTANCGDGLARLYRHLQREKKITPCGDDCLACPRYLARTREELEAVAELWHRAGWRDRVLPAEEMACSGCAAQKPCAYGLTDCGKARAGGCGSCEEFPCGKIRAALEASKHGQARCKAVCTQEEYAALDRAFFHKEENLGLAPEG